MHTVLLLADVPEQTLPARSMMAFTLASHIILVPLGVALPLITLVMHGYGLRRGDATALLLARRWSAVMAVQFAIATTFTSKSSSGRFSRIERNGGEPPGELKTTFPSLRHWKRGCWLSGIPSTESSSTSSPSSRKNPLS